LLLAVVAEVVDADLHGGQPQHGGLSLRGEGDLLALHGEGDVKGTSFAELEGGGEV